MEDVGVIVVLLGDIVGPFQPYVEVEKEEEVIACDKGLTLLVVVDVGSDLRGDPSVVRDPREIIVLQDEADVPSPAHTDSKVGKIPPGTYSRVALRGTSGSTPLLKRPHLGQLPSVGLKMDVNVACHVVQPEVGRSAENARGKAKRIKFIESNSYLRLLVG